MMALEDGGACPQGAVFFILGTIRILSKYPKTYGKKKSDKKDSKGNGETAKGSTFGGRKKTGGEEVREEKDDSLITFDENKNQNRRHALPPCCLHAGGGFSCAGDFASGSRWEHPNARGDEGELATLVFLSER